MSKLRQVSDLDLKLLRTFAEIVERGGFAAAQSTLNISQSVLSENLKTLEIRLGLTLCKRGPGGFKLLPEGEEVYKAAKQLFDAVDVFRSGVGEIGDEVAGELIIALEDEVISNPACRVPEALQRFTAEVGSKGRFRVENMAGYQALSHVADGSAHVGIGVSHACAHDVNSRLLFEESVVLYCAESHPLYAVPDSSISSSEISAQRYSSRGNVEFKDLQLHTHEYQLGDVGLGAQAQLALVLSGRDVGFLPEHLARPHVASGKLRALRPDLTRKLIPINVVTRDSGPLAKLVAKMRACLVAAHAVA
jgi:DNA-binding transcriptional LysR family regulator